jgi:Mg-chelatase subunit ChlD
LPQIFSQNAPAGGTNLAQPLAVEIGEYLRRREYSRGNAKPVMIGVITDGCPNNKQAVRESIIQATQLMKRPDEITIIFFLIGGMDFMGERFVNELTNNLTSEGARFPIVREVSFGELQHIGLAKAIAQNLR